MISLTKTDKNMYCYRPNGSRYAMLSPYQWRRLRKQGQLDSYLCGQSFTECQLRELGTNRQTHL